MKSLWLERGNFDVSPNRVPPTSGQIVFCYLSRSFQNYIDTLEVRHKIQLLNIMFNIKESENFRKKLVTNVSLPIFVI